MTMYGGFRPEDWGIADAGAIDEELRTQREEEAKRQLQAAANVAYGGFLPPFISSRLPVEEGAIGTQGGGTAQATATGVAEGAIQPSGTAAGLRVLPPVPNRPPPELLARSNTGPFIPGSDVLAGQGPPEERGGLSFPTLDTAGMATRNALGNIGAPGWVQRPAGTAADLITFPMGGGGLAGRAIGALAYGAGTEAGEQAGVGNIPYVGQNPVGLIAGAVIPGGFARITRGEEPSVARITPEELRAAQLAKAQELGLTPEEMAATGMQLPQPGPQMNADVNVRNAAREAYSKGVGPEMPSLTKAQFDEATAAARLAAARQAEAERLAQTEGRPQVDTGEPLPAFRRQASMDANGNIIPGETRAQQAARQAPAFNHPQEPASQQTIEGRTFAQYEVGEHRIQVDNERGGRNQLWVSVSRNGADLADYQGRMPGGSVSGLRRVGQFLADLADQNPGKSILIDPSDVRRLEGFQRLAFDQAPGQTEGVLQLNRDRLQQALGNREGAPAPPIPPVGEGAAPPARAETRAETLRDAELRALSERNLGMGGSNEIPPPSGRERIAGPNGELLPANPIDELAQKLLGGLGEDERLPPPGNGRGGSGGAGNGLPFARPATPGERAINELLGLWRLPIRVATVGADFLRTGIGAAITHPPEMLRALRDYGRTLRDPAARTAIQERLNELEFIGGEGPVGYRSVDFAQPAGPRLPQTIVDQALNAVPGLGAIVERNSAASVAYLDTLRKAIYNSEATRLWRFGERDPKAFRDLWDATSHGTGASGTHTQVSAALGYSTQAWLARLKTALDPFTKEGSVLPWNPGARSLAIRNLLGVAGVVATTNAAGWALGGKLNVPGISDVETMKWYGINTALGKVGFDRTTLDASAGYGPLVRFFANASNDIMNDDRAALEEHTAGYLRGQLGPTAGVALSLATGTDWKGDPYGPKDAKSLKAQIDIWAPFVAKSIYDAARIPGGNVYASLPELIGQNANTNPWSSGQVVRMERTGLSGKEFQRVQDTLAPYFSKATELEQTGASVGAVRAWQAQYVSQHPEIAQALRQGGYSVPAYGGTVPFPLRPYQPPEAPFSPRNFQPAPVPFDLNHYQYQPRPAPTFTPRNRQIQPVGVP